MSSITEIIKNYTGIFIHVVFITCASIPLLFSENLKVLGFLCLLFFIYFIRVVIYDKCIVADHERISIGQFDIIPSEIVKKVLCLGETVNLADLHKSIVGGILAVYLAKIAIILLVEVLFEVPIRQFLSVNPYINNQLIQVKEFL